MRATIIPLPPPAVPPPAPAAAPPDCALRGRLLAGLCSSPGDLGQAVGRGHRAGLIVVDSSVKKVQHPNGGVVGEILVRNGDQVAPGDILIRPDDTQTKAALGVILSQLVELTGRSARLVAERDDADAIAFPPDFARMGGMRRA